MRSGSRASRYVASRSCACLSGPPVRRTAVSGSGRAASTTATAIGRGACGGAVAPAISTNAAETVPYAFQQCELTGRVDNFIRAAKALRGEPLENTKPPGYPFDDTDLYKVIEGASYALSVHPDPKLDAYVDGLIATIAAAQEKDGYLYTARTIDPTHPHKWSGAARWELEKVDSHELYDLGHL